MDGVFCCVQLKFHRDAGQRNGVAQRNQFPGALGTLNRRDTRHAEHVAFFCAALLDHLKRFRLHENRADRFRDAVGFGFFADVNHVGLAPFIKMRECIAHG